MLSSLSEKHKLGVMKQIRLQPSKVHWTFQNPVNAMNCGWWEIYFEKLIIEVPCPVPQLYWYRLHPDEVHPFPHPEQDLALQHLYQCLAEALKPGRSLPFSPLPSPALPTPPSSSIFSNFLIFEFSKISIWRIIITKLSWHDICIIWNAWHHAALFQAMLHDIIWRMKWSLTNSRWSGLRLRIHFSL